MKCYYHKSKDADAECSSCGRPLCRACADYWGGRLCTDCVKSMAAKRRNTALLKILLVLVITTALFYLFYFTMQGHTAKDLYFALTGFGAAEKKNLFLRLWLGFIPAGLYAAKTFASMLAEKYDIQGKAAVGCLAAAVICGIAFAFPLAVLLVIRLVYDFIKYNVTVKAARKRKDYTSGKRKKK